MSTPTKLPGTRVRPNLSITPDAWTALEDAAIRLGVSASAVVELLARRYAATAHLDPRHLPPNWRNRKGLGRKKKAE